MYQLVRSPSEECCRKCLFPRKDDSELNINQRDFASSPTLSQATATKEEEIILCSQLNCGGLDSFDGEQKNDGPQRANAGAGDVLGGAREVDGCLNARHQVPH